jgi:hypothetical protein
LPHPLGVDAKILAKAADSIGSTGILKEIM